jgi:hypothetical protein
MESETKGSGYPRTGFPGGLRIYLASSWRNTRQPEVLRDLRAAGHDVFDFRHPAPWADGFAWESCGQPKRSNELGHMAVDEWMRALDHQRAREGFALDFGAMKRAEVGVLLLPCGKSAHVEYGWLADAGKRVFVLTDEVRVIEPELMYLVARHQRVDYAADVIVPTVGDLLHALDALAATV